MIFINPDGVTVASKLLCLLRTSHIRLFNLFNNNIYLKFYYNLASNTKNYQQMHNEKQKKKHTACAFSNSNIGN
jgi:hypothetical protein